VVAAIGWLRLCAGFGIRFHPSTDALLRFLSYGLEDTRVGLAESARRGLRVVLRQEWASTLSLAHIPKHVVLQVSLASPFLFLPLFTKFSCLRNVLFWIPPAQ
jgi:hypothetical protein